MVTPEVPGGVQDRPTPDRVLAALERTVEHTPAALVLRGTVICGTTSAQLSLDMVPPPTIVLINAIKLPPSRRSLVSVVHEAGADGGSEAPGGGASGGGAAGGV